MINNKLEQMQRFKKEHEAYRLLYMFGQWIHYDLAKTGNMDSLNDYSDCIIHVNNYFHKRNYNPDYMPKINESNFLSVWFDIKKNWCKDSMKEFNLEDKFDIVVRNNKYVFRNLTAIGK
jgi:hypothetical protein